MQNFACQVADRRIIITVKDGRAVCPVCGRKTQTRIAPETKIINFPLFCPQCRQTTQVNTEIQPEPEPVP